MKATSSTKVVAVTVLTSIDKGIMNDEVGVKGEVDKQVLRLAKLVAESGLDGIVCSGADLKLIKSKLPKDFMFVTPGIKGPNTSAGSDQKRVFTPSHAVKDGATILVIGRAITGAKDKVKAGLEVLEDIAKVL
ncbi:MAG: orotidine 5'-phosphate decarboxylase / HUMPS family protein [Nanoarchaeota archaeon]